MNINHLLLLLFFYSRSILGQITVPYNNHFDNVEDTIGWSHYSLNGIDNWMLGHPNGVLLSSSSSVPNAWATNTNANYSAYSTMVLQSPSFNLSDTCVSYFLEFTHKWSFGDLTTGQIEYSIDMGQTWILLNGNIVQKQNWFNSSEGFKDHQTKDFIKSSHSLASLRGNSNVIIRFILSSSGFTDEGWLIDDFSVQKEISNIKAFRGKDLFNISKNYTHINVVTPVYADNQFYSFLSFQTKYYLSKDSTLDNSDKFLGERSANISGLLDNYEISLMLPENLDSGYYYLVYKHEASIFENDKSDNSNYIFLEIDSTFNIPEYSDNFEGIDNYWRNYAFSQYGAKFNSYWKKGENRLPKIFGTNSGKNSWYISQNPEKGGYETTHILESPFLDVKEDENVFCFWYKVSTIYNNSSNLNIQLTRDLRDNNTIRTVPFSKPRFSNWDCHCTDISYLYGANSAKIAIKFNSYAHHYEYADKINIDDIYIGSPKPDLSIEYVETTRTYPNTDIDTLRFTLFNSGSLIAEPFTINFYLSSDSIYDKNDPILFSTFEDSLAPQGFRLSKLAYTKPNIKLEKFYIFGKIDSSNIIDEMREDNNQVCFNIIIDSIYNVPYHNDFEIQIDGWEHTSTIGIDDWVWGKPSGIVLDTAFSGSKAFITNHSGMISPNSIMHLYTPTFNLTTLNNPVLEFDMKLDSDGLCNCDVAKTNMSYSIDGGYSWNILDTINKSYKCWYYPMEYNSTLGTDEDKDPPYTANLFEPYEKTFTNISEYHSRDSRRLTKYIIDVSHLKQYKNIRFRFNTGTPNDTNIFREGVLIDNFSLSESRIDLVVDYTKKIMLSSISEKIKFNMDVKNNGNYLANSSIINFYTSYDSLLDNTDVYIGQAIVENIRPDMYCHINCSFNSPSNIANYNNLIFQLDANNKNVEIDENNNVGYWNLVIDKITTYPYIMNFNDTIVDGWYYKTDKGKHRIRNILAPGEDLYETELKSGEMFTDKLIGYISEFDIPTFYLETPSFDFSRMDSVFMSFDLFCSGAKDKDGGNLSFSTDGGNTWKLLTSDYGTTFNWYNCRNLYVFNDEPGWSGYAKTGKTSMDISFLKGNKHVVFRYKYRSAHEHMGAGSLQGFRLDNFIVDAKSIDYVIDNHLDSIQATVENPKLYINYGITNLGTLNGKPTITNIYWSKDSILDYEDSIVKKNTPKSNQFRNKREYI